jgi:hypothetical protein
LTVSLLSRANPAEERQLGLIAENLIGAENTAVTPIGEIITFSV